MLVLKVIRCQSKKTLIQRYHNNVAESAANGRIHLSVSMAFYLFGLILLAAVGCIIKKVSIADTFIYCIAFLTLIFTRMKLLTRQSRINIPGMVFPGASSF